MKLYTEEQVRETWNKAYLQGMSVNKLVVLPIDLEEHLETQTHIELPSEDDLLVPFPTEEDDKFENGNEIKFWMNGWEKGYLEAIQSLRNKIKGDK